MAEPDTVLVAVEADPHINSKAGLPPGVRFQLHKQDDYSASPLKRKLWRHHQAFWQLVREEKAKLDVPLAVILNGDLLDVNVHDRLDPITHYELDIKRMGTAVYEPIREAADYFFVIRGTAAHTGEWSELEEWLANDLNATPDEVNGTASWGVLWATLAGVTVWARHHPHTVGHRPWTQGPSTAREQEIINFRFLRDGVEPPDVAFVAHYHWYDESGRRLKPQVYRCPSWKLLDSYGEQRGSQRIVESVGALLFLFNRGRVKLWPEGKPHLTAIKRRRKPWTAT